MDILKTFLTDWLTSLNLGTTLVDLIVKVLMIITWLLLGYIGTFIAKFFINRLKKKERQLVKRQRTIAALVISISKYVFWFIIIMMILLELGLDLAPILASAGILGFAVGFGAQELIKDLISGFFIIFEQAFNVGDTIQVGDFKGTVLEVGIRRTKLVNWKNEVRLINNGDIRVITQSSIGDSVGVVEFHVSPNFDLREFYSEKFVEVLEKYYDKPFITEAPKYVGVIDTQLHNTTLRVTFRTENNKHAALERELKRDIQLFLKEVRDNQK